MTSYLTTFTIFEYESEKYIPNLSKMYYKKKTTTVFKNLAVFTEMYKITLREDGNYLDASAQPFCAPIDLQVNRHVQYNK